MADDKTGSSSIFMDSSWPRYGARAQMSSHTAFSRSHSFLPSISCLSTCSWWWVRGYNCSPFPPWRDKRRTSVMRFHSYSSAFLSATSCASLASLFAASSASFSFASWAFCSASANASSRSWVSMMLVHELRQQPVSRTVHHTQAQPTNWNTFWVPYCLLRNFVFFFQYRVPKVFFCTTRCAILAGFISSGCLRLRACHSCRVNFPSPSESADSRICFSFGLMRFVLYIMRSSELHWPWSAQG